MSNRPSFFQFTLVVAFMGFTVNSVVAGNTIINVNSITSAINAQTSQITHQIASTAVSSMELDTISQSL